METIYEHSLSKLISIILFPLLVIGLEMDMSDRFTQYIFIVHILCDKHCSVHLEHSQ